MDRQAHARGGSRRRCGDPRNLFRDGNRFQFGAIEKWRRLKSIMTNRVIARRALYATFFVLSVFTLLFSQPPFETCAKPRRQTTISSLTSSSTAQATRRNIGAVFDKLRAGKSVTIAYLGGSITAGAGATNPEKSS